MPRSLSLAVFAALVAVPAMASDITFRHALDNQPLALDYRPDQKITPEVEHFHETGENIYVGEADAIAAGKKIYKKNCQACHMPDGSGRIGPNLVDNHWKYKRADTEVGRFEVIYGGGAGAMQAFGRRLDQDEILRVMAFIDSLRSE